MMFGAVMISLGYINEQQLDFALREQEYNLQTVSYSEPIGSILLRNGIINEFQHISALLEYFKALILDENEPAHVKEMAKIAIKALDKSTTEDKMSEESKLILINKIEEYKEKILQIDSNPSRQNEAQNLQRKIDDITKDINKYA